MLKPELKLCGTIFQQLFVTDDTSMSNVFSMYVQILVVSLSMQYIISSPAL